MDLEPMPTDPDAPFVGCSDAARRLGLGSSEAVRQVILRGELHARRAHDGYNAPYEIPEREIVALCRKRGITDHAATPREAPRPSAAGHPITTMEVELLDRVRALEDSLITLRAANEHARRAYDLQQESFRELLIAYAMLEDAVTGTVVPGSPKGAAPQP
jgi:hypothetical protein